jgi:hypothetical protein
MELQLDEEGHERSPLPARLVPLRIHEGAPYRTVLAEDPVGVLRPLEPLA